MTWFKVDDTLYSHTKVVTLPLDALGMWTKCGSYCASHPKACGVITLEIAAWLVGSKPKAKSLASKLVEAGLWDVVGDGWAFHDWLEFNPTPEQIEERRVKRADAGKQGGIRSGESRGSKTEAKRKQVASTETETVRSKNEPYAHAQTRPVPSRPVPNLDPPLPPEGGGVSDIEPVVHAEPEPAPTEGVTPIKSTSVAFMLLDDYVSAANAALGGGFSADRYSEKDIAAAINAAVGTAILTGAEVRSRLRFSVDRYLRGAEKTFDAWTQPKHWRRWVANGNGWTLAKPAPVKRDVTPSRALAPLPKPAPPSAELLAALDAADAVMGNVAREPASGIISVVADNDAPSKGVARG